MERTAANIAITLAKAQQALAACVLTDLELGLTFLDVAVNSTDRKRAQRSVRHAIAALRSANRCYPKLQHGAANLDAIRQRREQLAQRLRLILGVEETLRSEL